jgi:hypothetical protein
VCPCDIASFEHLFQVSYSPVDKCESCDLESRSDGGACVPCSLIITANVIQGVSIIRGCAGGSLLPRTLSASVVRREAAACEKKIKEVAARTRLALSHPHFIELHEIMLGKVRAHLQHRQWQQIRTGDETMRRVEAHMRLYLRGRSGSQSISRH